ncbi:pituitary tumor-transforming gene 1 protein-interacting protein-like isoform X1 [Branchiostoma floridae x Branchiostoma japonicum]
MSGRYLCLAVAVFLALFCAVTAQTTTPAPELDCSERNSSCDECIKNVKCYYCYQDNSCRLYPAEKILPRDCPLSKARWGISCAINFEALIIAMSVVGGVILISFFCCIYCCCCRTSSKKAQEKYDKEDAKIERAREERRLKHAERRAERDAKNQEIRMKYGLVKEDNPYHRFDQN